uniref:Uncharacterized protein n=1 Tax=Oryza glaberrima TaxID=4538 RepID=I1QGL8_ORYGL
MAESKKRGIRDWIGDSQRKRNRKPGRLFFLLPLSSRPPRLRLRGRETDGGFGMRSRRREMNSGEGKNSKHLSVLTVKYYDLRTVKSTPFSAPVGRP